jgi:cobaltochelatase CobN
MLVGKAVNLARLQTMPTPGRSVALLFWNHPPGEKNQGASNMNVPRSIEHLVDRLRDEGYAFDAVTEQEIIAAVGQMLRPAYRKGGPAGADAHRALGFSALGELQALVRGLADKCTQDIEQRWGAPEKSAWIARKDGVTGFVIPRLKLGKLVVMPQPSRGEMAHPTMKRSCSTTPSCRSTMPTWPATCGSASR